MFINIFTKNILTCVSKKIVVIDKDKMIPAIVKINKYYTTRSRNTIHEGDYIEFS